MTFQQSQRSTFLLPPWCIPQSPNVPEARVHFGWSLLLRILSIPRPAKPTAGVSCPPSHFLSSGRIIDGTTNSRLIWLGRICEHRQIQEKTFIAVLVRQQWLNTRVKGMEGCIVTCRHEIDTHWYTYYWHGLFWYESVDCFLIYMSSYNYTWLLDTYDITCHTWVIMFIVGFK